MPGYSYSEKANMRLQAFNAFANPFRWFSAKGLSRDAVEFIRRQVVRSLLEIEFDPKNPLGYIEIRLDYVSGVRPVQYPVYVSAQVTPIRPYQAERIVKKLLGVAAGLPPGDKAPIVYAPGGVTSGAYKIFKKHGVYVARTIDEVVDFIVRYFKERWGKLKEKLRGRRIWGPVALLALMLAEILKFLGHAVVSVLGLAALFDAATGRGPPVSLDALPPPA